MIRTQYLKPRFGVTGQTFTNQREREMELTRARQGIASTQQPQLSKISRIVQLLTVLGIRRQAKLDKEDYQVFASDLESCDLGDIETALNLIASKPRAEGETAFPDVATIMEAIRSAARVRRAPAKTQAEIYREKVISEGVVPIDPELQAKIDALNKRFHL